MKKRKLIISFLMILFITLASTLFSSCSQKYNFDVEFNDLEVVADGNIKEIVLTGDLPDGYTVSYENNQASSAGDYYATANIKNSKGKVVKSYYATLSIDNKDSSSFESYLDNFLIDYLDGDQISINILINNPSDFELKHCQASWYIYHGFDENDLKESKAFMEESYNEFKNFDYSSLSNRQKIAYQQIDYFYNYYIQYYGIDNVILLELNYVNQFGGYVADFESTIDGMRISNKQDIEDIIQVIQSTSEAFPSYIDYVKDRADKGFPLSNYTINAMCDYLDGILKKKDDYNLIKTLENKMQQLDFINESEIEYYCTQIERAFKENYFNAVDSLNNGIKLYLNKYTGQTEGYWSLYQDGAKLYKLELENLLGYKEIDMEEYIKILDTAINDASNDAISATYKLIFQAGVTDFDELNKVINENAVFSGTPEQMLEFLKDFAKTIVPDLKYTPEITIKEMDEVFGEVSNAVAYYMKSPIDLNGSEYITLNPVKIGDTNDVLSTLAHEGYPGHLYAYLYSKQLALHPISKIMTSTAHAEGWAKYVEIALFDYAQANAKNNKQKIVAEYLYANAKTTHLLESRIDVGIHYEHWNIKEVGNYLKKMGYDSSMAQEIYRLLIETPVTYAAYGYGMLKFEQLHEEARTILYNDYDEVEFNAMLLSKGWTSLEVLEETYKSYMKKKCHQLNISF